MAFIQSQSWTEAEHYFDSERFFSKLSLAVRADSISISLLTVQTPTVSFLQSKHRHTHKAKDNDKPVWTFCNTATEITLDFPILVWNLLLHVFIINSLLNSFFVVVVLQVPRKRLMWNWLSRLGQWSSPCFSGYSSSLSSVEERE